MQLAPWLNAIGYSLCFGTIVVKMFRVYYIFGSPTPAKKLVSYTVKFMLAQENSRLTTFTRKSWINILIMILICIL